MLTPTQITERLEAIEQDLADVGPEFGAAAEQWTRDKRTKEKAWADAYTACQADAVTDRKVAGIAASEDIGVESEAKFTGCKAVVDVLQTRAMIGMALLKSHGRVEGPAPTGHTYGSGRTPTS